MTSQRQKLSLHGYHNFLNLEELMCVLNYYSGSKLPFTAYIVLSACVISYRQKLVRHSLVDVHRFVSYNIQLLKNILLADTESNVTTKMLQFEKILHANIQLLSNF